MFVRYVVCTMLFLFVSVSGVLSQDSSCDIQQLFYVTENKVDTAQIRVIDATTKNDRVFLDIQNKVTAMDWSLDGQQLAFANSDLEGNYLSIINADSSNQHNILETPTIFKLQWSPDSSHLAFINGRDELYIIKPDGTNLSQVQSELNILDFTWSPDSEYLAVEDRNSLYLVDTSNLNATPISEPSLTFATKPSWIAGSLITFTSSEGIRIIDPFAPNPESKLFIKTNDIPVIIWENNQVSDAIIIESNTLQLFRNNEMIQLTDGSDSILRLGWSSGGEYIAYSFFGIDSEERFLGIRILNIETGENNIIHKDADTFAWRSC